MHFEFKDNVYTLVNHEGRVLDHMDRVAVCFSSDKIKDSGSRRDAIPHKYGQVPAVMEWARDAKARMTKVGLGVAKDMADHLYVIVFRPGFPVEYINRCMTTTGFFDKMIYRMHPEMLGGKPYTEGEFVEVCVEGKWVPALFDAKVGVVGSDSDSYVVQLLMANAASQTLMVEPWLIRRRDSATVAMS